MFDAMLQNAARICDAKLGDSWVRESDRFRIVAIHGASPVAIERSFSGALVVPDPRSALRRVAATRQVLPIDDISTAPTYGMTMPRPQSRSRKPAPCSPYRCSRITRWSA